MQREAMAKVTSKTPVPKDWQNFPKNRENKIQLVALSSEALARSQIDKTLVTTKGDTVLTNKPIDIEDLMPCNHAEADSGLLLHVAHGSFQGHKKLLSGDCIVILLQA